MTKQNDFLYHPLLWQTKYRQKKKSLSSPGPTPCLISIPDFFQKSSCPSDKLSLSSQITEKHFPAHNPLILKAGRGRRNRITSSSPNLFCSTQSRVAHFPRKFALAICSGEKHLLSLMHFLSPENSQWTNLCSLPQNVSLQLDYSLIKFSIQSYCQKLSGNLIRSRLRVAAFWVLLGAFGLACLWGGFFVRVFCLGFFWVFSFVLVLVVFS